MITSKDTAQRREVGSRRNLPKSLSANSEPLLTGKTQVINEFNCYPPPPPQGLLGVERNFNMLVSKYCEVVQCGSGKSHCPRLDGSNGTLRYSSVSVRVPYPNCGSDTGIHITWNIGQEIGEHVSPQTRVDRSIRLATYRNRRITTRSLQMRYLGRHGMRMSVHPFRNRLHASQFKSRKFAQKPLVKQLE